MQEAANKLVGENDYRNFCKVEYFVQLIFLAIDLNYVSQTWKFFSVFFRGVFRTQPNIYSGAFFAKIAEVVNCFHKKAPL